MATTKPTKTAEAAAKELDAASDLLKEERRVRRELTSRIKALESSTVAGSSVATGLARKQVSGFIDFLREQSVVGLAIGLVLGTQMKQLVDSIVNNFISPLVGLLLPGQQALADKAFVVHALGKTSQPFKWGQIVTTLISFIAVAAVVYALFKALRLDRLTKKKDEAAPKKEKTVEKDEKAEQKDTASKTDKKAT